MIVLQAFAVGLLVGGGFVMLGLPVPAPTSLAGLAGVVGLTTALLIGRWAGI